MGDWHAAAQRNLFNRMLGQLYHCLQQYVLFDENTAFPIELAAAAYLVGIVRYLDRGS